MDGVKSRKSFTLDADVVQYIERYAKTNRVSNSTAVNQIIAMHKEQEQKKMVNFAEQMMDKHKDVFDYLAK
ncbi:hypothetical protein [Persicobacter psychrovividus]